MMPWEPTAQIGSRSVCATLDAGMNPHPFPKHPYRTSILYQTFSNLSREINFLPVFTIDQTTKLG